MDEWPAANVRREKTLQARGLTRGHENAGRDSREASFGPRACTSFPGVESAWCDYPSRPHAMPGLGVAFQGADRTPHGYYGDVEAPWITGRNGTFLKRMSRPSWHTARAPFPPTRRWHECMFMGARVSSKKRFVSHVSALTRSLPSAV